GWGIWRTHPAAPSDSSVCHELPRVGVRRARPRARRVVSAAADGMYMARKDNCLKVIRMSNAERRDVLARLDETEAAHVGANRRRAPRLSFRRTHVKIQITQPEGMT